MENIFGPVFSLIPFAIIALVIYAVVQLMRRRDTLKAVDPGIGTVRRLYFYIVSFVALMVAANGVVQIGKFVLEGLFGGDVLSLSRTGLAVGAALTIVGLPIWAFHWRLIQRHLEEIPVERTSWIRKIYLYLVLGVAAALAIVASVSLLQWAFGSKDFGGYPWSAAVVWIGIWAFHWRLEGAEGQPTAETLAIRRLYLYLMSLSMLVMVAVGFGLVVHIILQEGYASLVSVTVLLPSESGLWRPPMRSALALLLVGAVVWGTHWLHFARADYGSLLRRVYLYVFTILGGVIPLMVSLGIVMYGVLVWLMGVPIHEAAGTHFRFLPAVLASLSVGGGLWAYHWTVVQREAEASPSESRGLRRSYAYILAALGLDALAVGVATLVTGSVGILAESSREVVTGPDVWRNQMAMVITLGLLGGPLWGYYWWSVQRQSPEGDAGQPASLTRRIFVFAVLGVGALAGLGSLIFLIFVFLRDLLEGELSLSSVRDARVALGIVAAVAVFLPYYWMVHRQDSRAEALSAVREGVRPRRKEVTLLVARGGDAFGRGLEAALGYRVNSLVWADPDASQPQISEAEYQELAGRIGDAAGSNVLLIPSGATVRVLSYE